MNNQTSLQNTQNFQFTLQIPQKIFKPKFFSKDPPIFTTDSSLAQLGVIVILVFLILYNDNEFYITDSKKFCDVFFSF